MKRATCRVFASLIALAVVCPVGACAVSEPLEFSGGAGGSSHAGGATGSGGASATGGATGSGGAPATGGATGSGGASAGEDSGAALYANFATVQQMVQGRCGGGSCHNSGLQDPSLTNDSTLYATLTSYKAPDCMNYALVKPGAPMQSALYLVIAGSCGDVPQMPDGCTGGDPSSDSYSCLPPDVIQGIWDWIDAGAPQQ